MNIHTSFQTKIKHSIQKTDYIIGSDILENLHLLDKLEQYKFSKFLLLSDNNVYELFGKKVIGSLQKLNKEIIVSTFLQGERSKDLMFLPGIIAPYFRKGFDRNACLISLGGGVTSDIGGFISSTLLRGISLIHIPTTLLGQTDAAIGGKTGVNFQISENRMYKNMIGTFYQPNLVVSDVDVLQTLPPKEIQNGLGEIVKYWIGWGKPTIQQIKLIIKSPASTPGVELTEIISLCQRIKIDLITKDPFEQSGERQKLNLGHTIGHVIEGASNSLLSHGKSVAIGLAAAAKISLSKEFISNQIYRQIIRTMQDLGLPTRVPKNVKLHKIADLLKAVKMDKKGGTFVLIRGIGKLETGINVDKDLIEKALKEITI